MPKLLVIGIDGAGFDLIEQFVADGIMPNIGALISRGLAGPLRSTTPPITLPAWTSFFTGAPPSYHGLTDFTVRDGYRVKFIGAQSRRLPTLFEHLEDNGLSCGVAWFPATYPPERLKGFQISGWDSPVTAKGDSSFVHPQSLHSALFKQFGDDHLKFDSIDEFDNSSDWHLQTAAALPARVHRRAQMASWLMDNNPVDVAAFYFGETDTAAHHFWAFHDPSSPRRPKHFDSKLTCAIKNVYRAVDDAVGLLSKKAGKDTSIVILSDHGSGGSSNIGIHLNRVLEETGLLAFRSKGFSLNPSVIRGSLPGLVPPSIRRRLFRAAGGLAPSIMESKLRFGGIDWKRTMAFSEEINYSPSIWFNQLGREPKGTLPFKDRDKAALRIERALSRLFIDETPLIKRVWRREELHTGPYSHLLPDLTIEFYSPDGYLPACLPSSGKCGTLVSKLSNAELLGRKGRSLPGCHTPDGVLIVASPANFPCPPLVSGIEQVASMVASLAGVQAAQWFIPANSSTKSWALPKDKTSVYTGIEQRVVARRLKRLGYLED